MLKIPFKNLVDTFQSALVVTMLALILLIGGASSADAQGTPQIQSLVFPTDGQVLEGTGIALEVTLSEASDEAFTFGLDLRVGNRCCGGGCQRRSKNLPDGGAKVGHL